MLVSKVSICRLFLGFVAATALSHAQTTAAPAAGATYDAVSIKPNKTGSGSMRISISNGHYAATNVSLKALLQTTYDVKEDQISGIPGAIDSQRFDIEAKIVEPDLDAMKNMDVKERRAMMLPVLADRFHLQAHQETKILPVFDLVVVDAGPKFKPVSLHDEKSGHTSFMNRGRAMEMSGHEVTLDTFARLLSTQVHRTVVDKTGLAEKYDLTLKWSPEDSTEPSADASPGIFTALQEQLGLKLMPAKGPVETLVVDHVEMPTEN
jgi:uncharacterized protein (TIGR03435 family)